MDFSDDLQIHDPSSDLCHRFMSYSAFHVCTLCGLAPPSQRMPSISPFSEANFLRILVLVTNTRTAILCQLYDLMTLKESVHVRVVIGSLRHVSCLETT